MGACDGGKCQWICIPILGGMKTVVSLCLIIIAIVMMAHSGMDCEGVTKCYKDKNIYKCSGTPTRRRRSSYRRLNANERDSYAGDAVELETKPEQTLVANSTFLGIELTIVKMINQVKAKGKIQSRRLDNCYTSWDESECETDNDSLREESSKWGATFMVVAIVAIASGGCSCLAGKLKQRRWMIITMVVDILLMIVGAVIAAMGYYISGFLAIICQAVKDWQDEVDGNTCFDENVAKVCEWAGMFFWAAVMLTILCVIWTVSSVLDCTATCCCPPEDAHWATKAPPTTGSPVTIGQPVQGQAVTDGKAETNAAC